MHRHPHPCSDVLQGTIFLQITMKIILIKNIYCKSSRGVKKSTVVILCKGGGYSSGGLSANVHLVDDKSLGFHLESIIFFLLIRMVLAYICLLMMPSVFRFPSENLQIRSTIQTHSLLYGDITTNTLSFHVKENNISRENRTKV